MTVSFLVGSIPTGVIVGSFYGTDIRKAGSGNIGATNALRVLGKKAAALTFLGDFLKGLIPILLISKTYHSITPNQALAAQATICVIIGHCFSPFLKGRGGKGIATSFGCFLLLTPIPALLCFVTFILTVWKTKFVSLGSLIASLVLSITVVMFYGGSNAQWVIRAALGVTLLIFIKHQKNILRLVRGEESRLSKKHSSTL
ncbi:glycerol-3-phosphate 1-O-acyltransferase PlsY [bacterium]|nr:glycerol-3-phosphate 1-O-acyltransferase PlsY [bacterium]